MSSLPETFDKHLRNAINARAIWLPGSPIQIGDILIRNTGVLDKGAFKQVGHISDFGATIKSASHVDISLDLASSKVKQRVFQAGVEIGKDELDLAADASVKFEFGGKNQFILKTPSLGGLSIQNLLGIGEQLAAKPNWNNDDFFIVSETFGATDWTFLGVKENSSNFEFSGKGSGILSLLTAGISAGLKTSGTIDIKLAGKSGMIGMNLVRIRKDGTVKPSD
jgi:hypothetical protein